MPQMSTRGAALNARWIAVITTLVPAGSVLILGVATSVHSFQDARRGRGLTLRLAS